VVFCGATVSAGGVVWAGALVPLGAGAVVVVFGFGFGFVVTGAGAGAGALVPWGATTAGLVEAAGALVAGTGASVVATAAGGSVTAAGAAVATAGAVVGAVGAAVAATVVVAANVTAGATDVVEGFAVLPQAAVTAVTPTASSTQRMTDDRATWVKGNMPPAESVPDVFGARVGLCFATVVGFVRSWKGCRHWRAAWTVSAWRMNQR
jgi:hypothetical protein